MTLDELTAAVAAELEAVRARNERAMRADGLSDDIIADVHEQNIGIFAAGFARALARLSPAPADDGE